MPALRPRTRTLLVDAALAAALGAVMLGPYYAGVDRPQGPAGPVAFALIGVAVAAVLARRVMPLPALGAATAAVAAHLAAGFPDGPILLAVPVCAYSVGIRHPIRRSLAACAVGAAVLVAVDVADWSRWSSIVGAVAEWGVVCGLAPWAVGAVVRLERRAAGAARAQAHRAEVLQERLRTAHDVHDVVGHGLAAIAMQAGVAIHVLDRSPQRAREALVAIRGSSLDALDELRGALALFRAAEDAPAGPGLDRVTDLVRRTSGAGLPVSLESSLAGPLPAGVERAAYRIVQESLTNALRHAGPATASVRLDRADDELVVEVVDTGRGDGGTGDGLGITGMRARAEALGGALDAGPGPGGGFVVRARLPVRSRP